MLKWVQKDAQGVLRPWGGSKLRCESNGMPTGPQNQNKNIKDTKRPRKSRKSRISYISPTYTNVLLRLFCQPYGGVCAVLCLI